MIELEENHSKHLWLAGCDEAGRGPLAGPVVGACVLAKKCEKAKWSELVEILKTAGVQDSKKAKALKRQNCLKALGLELKKNVQILSLGEKEKFQLHCCVQEISALEIDQSNILIASLKSMEESFYHCAKKAGELAQPAGRVLIDGNRLSPTMKASVYNFECLIKGDSKSVLIGLASFLAKEFRDLKMKEFDELYPGYGLAQHAGYPTQKHKAAIVEMGASQIHRKTFKGVREYL